MLLCNFDAFYIFISPPFSHPITDADCRHTFSFVQYIIGPFFPVLHLFLLGHISTLLCHPIPYCSVRSFVVCSSDTF